MKISNINEMVRDAAPGSRRELGGADVETTVELDGIVIHDFAAEGFGEREGQGALAAAGGTDDDD